MAAVSLPHALRPLSEGYLTLIKILAERAVADYLGQIEAADGTDQECARHQEMHNARE